MESTARTQADDGFVMGLVDEALARPEEQREEFVRKRCADDRDLFQEVWRRVELERRLGKFLLDPLIPRIEVERSFDPGQVLNGRFQILREIGRGGMGVVHEAIDRRLNKRVAIKRANPGFQRRLPPEARHATEINHPNVCRVYEIHSAVTPYGEVDFLTMEYLDGETLSQRLERCGPLSHEQACKILQHVCEGLEEAHRKGIIHGDLKSSNIFLTTSDEGAVSPVITDFGLAQPSSGAALSMPVAIVAGGTPAYMAPELWRDAKGSVKSDVYALGVVFYECLTGRVPRTITEDGRTQLASTPRLLRVHGAGRRWNRVISSCLERDPARRPASVAEVAAAIGACNRAGRLLRGFAAIAAMALGGPIILPEPTQAPIRLAMLPFDAPPEQRSMIDGALSESGELLSRVNHPGWHFSIIPLGESIERQVTTAEKACHELRATHVLQGRLRLNGGRVLVTASLTPACSQQIVESLDLEYEASEIVFMPAALASVVTRTLRIAHVTVQRNLNETSNADYKAGLKFLQREADLDKAISSLRRATSQSQSAASWAALAEAYQSKYKLTNDSHFEALAREAVGKGESLDPDSPPVYRFSGLLLSDAGLYTRAEDAFKRSIELEPMNSEGYRRIATVYQKLDRPQDSLRSLLRAVEVDPYDFESYKRLGRFYFDRGDYEKAAEELSAAVDLNPGEASVHSSIASAYIELGKYADAERELRTAIRIHETSTALVNLGVTLEYQGRDSEASSYERRATLLAPHDFLPWLNVAESCRRTGGKIESDAAYNKALDITSRTLTNHPQDAFIRAIRAYVLARLGDRAQAINEIKEALNFPPKDSKVIRTAALTYEALGMRNNTIEVLQEASRGLIADLSRHANLADLRSDSRFIELSAKSKLP